MSATPFTYGDFNLNDGLNYFLLKKEEDFVAVNQTYFKIGRLEGMKKTGDTVNQRQIDVDVRILGVSRADLENRLDVMYQSLNVRGQNLMLHTNDARYYIADCVNIEVELAIGNVVSAIAHLKFVAAQPFPYASTISTYDTGIVILTLTSGSTYTFPAINITGGGNTFSRPQIHLVAKNAVAWTQVVITQVNDNQALTLSTGLPATTGDYLDIYCDPNGSNGYTVQKNASGTPLAFNGFFPIMEPAVTQWTITINAASVPQAEAVFTWTARWLS